MPDNTIFDKGKLYHIVGIAGIGMSGIARMMEALGYRVQGSDMSTNETTNSLECLGIKCINGHSTDNLTNVHGVIFSSAIQEDNCEIIEAKRLGIPLYSRKDILVFLLKKMNRKICISGTHGKTTTTALVHSLLNTSLLIGGILPKQKTNFILDNSMDIVSEIDESDNTLSYIESDISVLTNIDKEHLENYDNNFKKLIDGYKNFINNTKQCLIYNMDDYNLHKVIGEIDNKKIDIISYGLNKNADIRLIKYNEESGDGMEFSISSKAFPFSGSVKAPLYGAHNAQNLLAAISTALYLGKNTDKINDQLKSFYGVKRRFEILNKNHNIWVIDDYAHHPKEITEAIKTANHVANMRSGKAIIIIQPHRYSRVTTLFEDFVLSCSVENILFIQDIYAAGEKEKKRMNFDLIHSITSVGKGERRVFHMNGRTEILAKIKTLAGPGDVVVCLGAGDVTDTANYIARYIS